MGLSLRRESPILFAVGTGSASVIFLEETPKMAGIGASDFCGDLGDIAFCVGEKPGAVIDPQPGDDLRKGHSGFFLDQTAEICRCVAEVFAEHLKCNGIVMSLDILENLQRRLIGGGFRRSDQMLLMIAQKIDKQKA